MYLSCLLIDVGTNPDRPRPGRLWLRNRYRVHQRLCMGFPYRDTKDHDRDFLKPYKPCGFRDPRPVYCAAPAVQHQQPCATVQPAPLHVPRDAEHNFLFRVDPQPGGRVVILVQSAVEPDWDYAFHNAGHLLAAPPEIKTVEQRIKQGDQFRFRLLANPTKRLRKDSRDSRGDPVNRKWVGKRVGVGSEDLENWLARRAHPGGFHVRRLASIQRGFIYVNKGERLRYRSAQYEGILEVTEPDRFRDTLVRGIGSAKAFGFGLLSVVPVR